MKDTYIPRTIPERLYKRAAKAHESDDLDRAFVLTLDVQAPTLEEAAAVQVLRLWPQLAYLALWLTDQGQGLRTSVR